MDNESQDFDLTHSQKSRLLSLGLRSKPDKLGTDKEEQKADMLYDVLSRTLPADPSVVNSLPPVVKGLSSRLRSLAGQPIGELLQDPATDITTIKKIKQYAKDSGTSSSSEAENDVFMAVYCAAIGSALVFHNEKITQHSYQDLEQFFLSFTRKDWILEEIAELLKKAQEYCQGRSGQADSSKK